jgi:tripartite-type tricarboxylate transporter receptor subunit TctC
MQGWNGYFVPKGTPKEVVFRLNRDLGTALRSREYADWLSNFGSEARPNSVEEFTDFIRSENERLRNLVKAANIHLEQ